MTKTFPLTIQPSIFRKPQAVYILPPQAQLQCLRFPPWFFSAEKTHGLIKDLKETDGFV